MYKPEFDLRKALEKVESYSPAFARKLVMQYLNMASPFNGHLKAKLVDWSEKRVKLNVKPVRSVKNHLGGVHAGALFTLGESCAGLLMIKNFSPQKFRLILKKASIEYEKQARGECFGVCEISSVKLKEMQAGLKSGEAFFVDMVTEIKNVNDEILCVAKTQWQIKSWDQVKLK